MTREQRQVPITGNVSNEGQHSEQDQNLDIRTSDREELIQCIKRGQRPTWVPKPGLEALCAETNAEHRSISEREDIPPRPQNQRPPISPSPLSATDALHRSLSALHTGDFRDSTIRKDFNPSATSPPGGDLYHPDFSSSSTIAWSPMFAQSPSPPASRSLYADPRRRSRAPSLGSSLSSSFVMRVPTSPLVHAMNNPSLDFSPREKPHDLNKNSRRRTMPPNAFETFRMSPIEDTMPDFAQGSPEAQPPSNDLNPSQRHKPRRSLSSFTYQSTPFPFGPSVARSRRPSLASDLSPRQRASMVGSFEESILRGRMSTPPSKPLDFVAQIGVVGKGNCPASLKCPAHVTVQFPAVFYNYPSANPSRSISDDNPSPYVGTIDLERNLKPAKLPIRRSRRTNPNIDTEALAAKITSPENTHIGRALAREVKTKPASTSTAKVPPGGVYRVPQTGQLQIIIKNPNKTAVKLFLVPYDLEGMLPGTKTFVRQRSFSSGPFLESSLFDKQSMATVSDVANGKDILRYLVHIKFCCTSKGCFYLYDNIRVVFANRVPDDKEKLRKEVQLPEPRFSAYIPPLETSPSPSICETMPSHTTGVTPEDSSLLETQDVLPTFGGMQQHSELHSSDASHASHAHHTSKAEDEMVSDESTLDVERTVSPIPGFLPSTSSRSSPVPWSASRQTPLVEAGDGLLSRKLRALTSQPPS
ncbi:hypothetical protein LTR84_002044 [Exophiala bonariae]|uniref:Atos-like conserved domain-containing protein n=1 Tax=Exophiala bonariae TaxID=1690606 RepID=A0AAV9NAE8_9EURO|nr:hypothetical protein LTR84_002044 [Exophiala bonariae]